MIDVPPDDEEDDIDEDEEDRDDDDDDSMTASDADYYADRAQARWEQWRGL